MSHLAYLNEILGLGLTMPSDTILRLQISPREIAMLRLLLLAQLANP